LLTAADGSAASTSTVAFGLLRRLQTPTTGVIAGALLILIGGIVYVSGAPSPGTILAVVGFGLILRFRVLPARRDRGK
jgi:hypothetical protein